MTRETLASTVTAAAAEAVQPKQHATLSAIPDTSNDNTAPVQQMSSLQEQITFFESILGISYETMRASDVTVKQQGDPTAATIVVHQKPSVDFQSRFNTIAPTANGADTQTDPVDTPRPDAEKANRTARRFNERPLASTGVPAVAAVPGAPKVARRKPQPPSQVPAKHTSGTDTSGSVKAKRARGASRFLASPSAPGTSSATGRPRKPLYCTECPYEINGGCNRAQCNLLHDDQQEYFFGLQHKKDEFPWRKTKPYIINDFKTDFPKFKFKK